jgi:5-methyltetrahydrofolate--homocysteine methyltransferase
MSSAPLEELKNAIVDGHAGRAQAWAESCLAAGMPAEVIFTAGIIPGIQETGKLWDSNRFNVPDVILSADAFNAAVAVIEQQLRSSARYRRRKVVLGVVEGDMHDLGKNIVSAMLQGAGFEVVDLGVDVPAQRFVAAVREERPAILGIGAYMSTTMLLIPEILAALAAVDLRRGVKILVGGAPTSRQFADAVGADDWAPHASAAVEAALGLVTRSDQEGGGQTQSVAGGRRSITGEGAAPR